MRLGGVLQRIGLVDLDLDSAGLHHLEQLFRHGNEALALGGIGIERRAGDEERSLLRQEAEVERLDAARRLAEQGRDTERRQAIQRFQERVLADGVVNHGHLLAPRDLVDAFYEILARVDDGMCLLYTSDAADEEDSVDLGGRRI